MELDRTALAGIIALSMIINAAIVFMASSSKREITPVMAAIYSGAISGMANTAIALVQFFTK